MEQDLILYISFTNTTKKLAEKIGEITGGETISLQAAEPYSLADLDWNDGESRCSQEHEHPELRPEIINLDEILKKAKKAKTIYVGFPTWWGTAPNIISTLLDKLSSTNQTLRIFTTSGGTDIDTVLANLRKNYPAIADGFQSGNEINETKIKQWVGDE